MFLFLATLPFAFFVFMPLLWLAGGIPAHREEQLNGWAFKALPLATGLLALNQFFFARSPLQALAALALGGAVWAMGHNLSQAQRVRGDLSAVALIGLGIYLLAGTLPNIVSSVMAGMVVCVGVYFPRFLDRFSWRMEAASAKAAVEAQLREETAAVAPPVPQTPPAPVSPFPVAAPAPAMREVGVPPRPEAEPARRAAPPVPAPPVSAPAPARVSPPARSALRGRSESLLDRPPARPAAARLPQPRLEAPGSFRDRRRSL